MIIGKEHYVTCGQMRLLEKRADADGLSYYQMMENAGTRAGTIILERIAYRGAIMEEGSDKPYPGNFKAAEEIITQIHEFKGNVAAKTVEKSIRMSNDDMNTLLFCGKGNNGGDGFVVARVLCSAGYRTTVILVDGEPKTEDAAANLAILKDMPVSILDMSRDERALMRLKGSPGVIVDAIYGTGFHGKLSGNALKASIYINRYSAIKGHGAVAPVEDKVQHGDTVVFAMDIPSGMGGDLTNEKELDHSSVTAHYTVTFHAKKPVHLQKFAKEYCGEIIVADIGIDEDKLWNVEI